MWPRSSGRSCNYNGLSKEVSEHKGTYNANTFTGDSDKINKGNKVRVTHTKLCSFECSCSDSEPTGQGQSKGCSSDLPVMEVPDPLHDVMEIHSDEETPAWKAIAGLCFPRRPCEKKMRSSDASNGNRRLEADSHMEATTTNDSNKFNSPATCVHYVKQRHYERGHFVHEEPFHSRDFATFGKEIAFAATLSAMVLGPVDGIFAATGTNDLVEIACSPTSTLAFENGELQCLRINHGTGYDLDSKKGTTALGKQLQDHRRLW